MAPQISYRFTSTLIEWRGPAPFYYLPVPTVASQEIKSMAAQLTYGWGVIPVTVTALDPAGNPVTWTTSLFPREGVYLLKSAVNKQLGGVVVGQRLDVELGLNA